MKWILLISCIFAGCFSSQSLPDLSDLSSPLPDLRIRKIEYRIMNQQMLAQRLIGSTIDYAFTIYVENIGDAQMAESFYFSVTGNTSDFQDHYYSHHVRVNELGIAIDPGKTHPFIIKVSIEPPPPNIRNYRYPIRFYLNTEGADNSAWFPTHYIAEKSRKNNYYELSMRIKTY